VDTGEGRSYRGVVTSPGDQRQPDEGGRPHPDQPYPTQQYVDPRYAQPGTPYGNGPYGSAGEPPYVYNPYGNVSYPATYPSAPAGLGGAPDAMLPARRPGSMHFALLLMVLSTLPYLLFGLVAVLGARTAAEAIPPDQLSQFEELGIDLEQFVRLTGIALLGIAVVFLLLAILAWSGRRWARALVAAMTVGFALMVVASVAAAGSQGVPVDAASLLLLAVPVVLAVVGVTLMFGRGARDWFSRPRR
jgi:hypothetical protein